MAAGAGLSAGGAASPPRFEAPYAPLDVSQSRLIGEIAGLRPYRASGFRIAAERLGDKTIVHNYGHGGCGVSLCFGSAELARRAAAGADLARVAVIGAGAIGLATALALARSGAQTTVYAEHLPPETTSNVAAALWEPTTLFRLDRVDQRFLADFRFAARHSHKAFRGLTASPRYGVCWIRCLTLEDEAPPRPREPSFEGDDLYPGMAGIADPARFFGFPYTEYRHALMIDTDDFMPALMEDAVAAGARIVRRRFDRPADLLALEERTVFNCTGMGAKALFGDAELVPVKGQLALVAPAPGTDYGYIHQGAAGLLYMFPRRGAIVLGGTHAWGEASTAIDAAETLRMLAGHAAIARRIAAAR